MVMRRFALLLWVLLLSGCSVLQGTPTPPPPATNTPQEIRHNQTDGLMRIGTVSVQVQGAPSDAEAQIRAKAIAARADYYVILMTDEIILTGQWYSQAILYRR